jgi:hypothetical protein
MEEKRPNAGPIVVAMLLLAAPLAYYGSYLAMLESGSVVFHWEGDELIDKTPYYRIQHPVISAVFAPAAWVDQFIRPGTWENTQA